MAISVALGVMFSAITAIVMRPTAALPAAIVFTLASCLVIGVDFARRELSHRALALAIVIVLTTQAFGALSEGEPQLVLGSLAGGAVAFVAVLAFHLVTPDSPTRDEVIYAALVGTTLGWFGLGRVGLGLGLGLVIAAVSAGPFVLAGRRRAGAGVVGRAGAMSIAPAMAVGGWIALCWGDAIVGWYATSRV